MPLKKRGPVAQLDRAPDYGSGGLGFESLRDHLERKMYLGFAEIFLFLGVPFKSSAFEKGRPKTKTMRLSALHFAL